MRPISFIWELICPSPRRPADRTQLANKPASRLDSPLSAPGYFDQLVLASPKTNSEMPYVHDSEWSLKSAAYELESGQKLD